MHQCVGVTWAPGRTSVGVPPCYLKSSLLTGQPIQSFEADSAVVIAAVAGPICASVTSGSYTTPTYGGQYSVSCNIDFPGADLATPPANDFAGCIQACDAWNMRFPGQCLAVSWVPGRFDNGNLACYLKGAGGSIPSPVGQPYEVDSAVLIQSAANLVCGGGVNNGTFTTANGVTYQTTCGWAIPGWDIAYPEVQTFGQCINACESYNAQNPGKCSGVSWVPNRLNNGTPCYLKGSNPSPNFQLQPFEVDSAVLVSVRLSLSSPFVCGGDFRAHSPERRALVCRSSPTLAPTARPTTSSAALASSAPTSPGLSSRPSSNALMPVKSTTSSTAPAPARQYRGCRPDSVMVCLVI
jgi:hypothetical protein